MNLYVCGGLGDNVPQRFWTSVMSKEATIFCGVNRTKPERIRASAFFAAVPGTTTRGTSAPRTATGTGPTTATGTTGSVSRARFHIFARACRVKALQGEAPKASRSGHDERRPARVLACLATRAGSIRAIRTVQLETTGRFGNAASQHAVPSIGGFGPLTSTPSQRAASVNPLSWPTDAIG